jgi:hypothetical protein
VTTLSSWVRARAVLAVAASGLFANDCATKGVDGSTHFVRCMSDSECPSDQICGNDRICLERKDHGRAGADGGSRPSSAGASGGGAANIGGAQPGGTAGGAAGSGGTATAALGAGGKQNTGGSVAAGGQRIGGADSGLGFDASSMVSAGGAPVGAVPCGSAYCVAPDGSANHPCCISPLDSRCGIISGPQNTCMATPIPSSPDAGEGGVSL